MECVFDATTSAYLPKQLAKVKKNFENEFYDFDYLTNLLSCKLLSHNPYRDYFAQVYPDCIEENELTAEMVEVLRSYTNSRSSEQFKKTNLNLLSANLGEIDWNYVNRLRSLIRGLVQTNIKHTYYRGLVLSDREVQYYLDRRNGYFYTNSFTSFTIDRLLVYSGNALIVLKTDYASETAKKNIANIWQWSEFPEEKEALLAVGSKLKILSVHYRGDKWEIEVELADESDELSQCQQHV